MLKKDYKALVATNRFDLNTLPICGARTRSGGLCKHKGNVRNGRCKRHGGDSTGPINQTFGKDHHRYVHGLRAKKVIAIRKLVVKMNQSLKGLVH
ncbi:HGGxSTG domain-containing protein [Candidatus Njordibacter sp. Uisw_039]|uniref:HGGxSTG domain-containing protein n=1 Tax=Candidatus Njordibacter sp. Uisw_039 TaxID=3230972 RepID=UPI003D492C23